MQRFIKKTVVTIGLFLIGIVLFTVGTHYVMKVQFDCRIPVEKKRVIVGHSHPQCAFDDALIPGFKNLGLNAESYFYTYQKVKQLASQNEIEAFYIEYSNNVIDEHMDYWIWGYEHMNYQVPLYAPFMEAEDLKRLYDGNKDDFLAIVSTSTRKNITKVVSMDFKMGKVFGGYKKLAHSKIPELLKMRAEEQTAPHSDRQSRKLSETNILYLEKIVAFCQANNIEVYFIRCPQHEYYDRDNEEELMRIKAQRFANIEFLDFDKFPLNDEQFSDFGHLHYKGTEVFSKWFAKLIEDGLLAAEDKPSFVSKALDLQIEATNSEQPTP